MVFAGYGVTAPEFGYDDYAGVDVTGKIVLMLRYEPAGFAAHTGNQGMTQHASLVTKAINARNHGAKGVVVVNGRRAPAIRPGRRAVRARRAAPGGDPDPLMKFGSVSGPTTFALVFVQARNRSGARAGWTASGGKSLADLQKQIDADHRSRHRLRWPTRCASTVRDRRGDDARHREQRAGVSAGQDR